MSFIESSAAPLVLGSSEDQAVCHVCAVPTSSGRCFSMTSLNMSVISVGSSTGAYFRSSPGIKSYLRALVLLSIANEVSLHWLFLGIK